MANLCVKTMNPSFYTKAQGCIKCWSSVGFQQTFAIWVFPQNFVILIQNTQTKGKNKKTIRKTSFHSNHKQAKSEVDSVCVWMHLWLNKCIWEYFFKVHSVTVVLFLCFYRAKQMYSNLVIVNSPGGEKHQCVSVHQKHTGGFLFKMILYILYESRPHWRARIRGVCVAGWRWSNKFVKSCV